MSKSTVLLTGATGYLGSHVAAQLLEQGYTVRAAVRPGKSERLRSMFPDAGDKLQTIEVASLTSDYTLAVRGVNTVVHCASPAFLQGETSKEILDGAYYGTVNVVNTAIKNGVKKIVITGTIASQVDPDSKAGFGTDPLTAKSYGSATIETIDTEKDAPHTVYQTAKTAADKKVWEIAHQNPDVDFTVILPPLIFGPFLSKYPLPAARSGLGTLDFVYGLITGGPGGPNTYPPIPVGYMVDVRDAAKAHILALDTAPLKDGRDKRINICKTFTWPEAAQVLREKRPELVGRLPGAEAVAIPQTNAPVDVQFAADVLGFTKYISLEETIVDSIDYALRWEKATGVKA